MRNDITFVLDFIKPEGGRKFSSCCQIKKGKAQVSFLINSSSISICIDDRITYVIDKDVCTAILGKIVNKTEEAGL